MGTHVRVRQDGIVSDFTRPYDIDSDGQPIIRSRVEKFEALKARLEASIARGGSHSSEEVAALIEARLRVTSGLKD
jgi:hypothetical protein